MSEIPNIDNVSTTHVDDEWHVIIKFDDGVDGAPKNLGCTEVRIARDLDHELDGWLDVSVYAGNDYAQPIKIINAIHPDHPIDAHEAAIDLVISAVTSTRNYHELKQGGMIARTLAEAFDKTAQNRQALEEDFEA